MAARTDALKLQDASKSELQQDANTLRSNDILGVMRKCIDRADAKLSEAGIFLEKDHYAEAVDSYKEASHFYRQALDGPKLFDAESAWREAALPAAQWHFGSTTVPTLAPDLSHAVDKSLDPHVAAALDAVNAKAADAHTKFLAGEVDEAIALTRQGTEDLKAVVAEVTAAVAEATAKENLAKAKPIIEQLDAAVANKEKFAAEDKLDELEALIPSDPRIAGLRDRIDAIPGPKMHLTIDLGGGITMEFVLIRPGSFMMGSEKGDSWEKPVHKVTITKPFYIARYLVTQEQWQAVMGSNPSNYKGARNPVETVSWDDCQTFVQKLAEKIPGQTFKLPSEAQWEYACRAGSTTEYCYGDDAAGLGEYAWFDGNSGPTTHPMGQKKPNAWGLYDMHGNVWEWCADWFGSYAEGELSDPVGPASGSLRVLRGGSWLRDPGDCRSADRSGSILSTGSTTAASGWRWRRRAWTDFSYPLHFVLLPFVLGCGGEAPARSKSSSESVICVC